ncbi:MAG TPA: multicopper oxidase domain-containing protein, partial [Amycolatopsis sp.]|nr:multicopper oxidase domain-containing protein [Amycolatopsis sp.]
MGGSVDRRTFLTSAVLGSASVVAGVNLLSSSAPAAAIGSGRPIQSAAPNFGLTKFLDPLRIPPAIQSYSRRYQDELTITMSNARSRLHSQLPETTLWTYEGQFPGPTIEVRGNRQLRVAWANELEGTVPLVAVRAPYAQPSPANLPGYRNPDGSLPAGVELIDGVADLPPWNVVHL